MFSSGDMSALFLFSTILLILPFVGLPVAYYFFPHASDRGYAFARLISLLALSYVGWLAGSLGIPLFTQLGLQLLLVFATLGSLILWYIKRKKLVSFVKKSWKILLTEELVFWVGFFIFVFIRWHNPDFPAKPG